MPAASTTTGACRRCTASPATGPAATSTATPKRSRGCRKTTSTLSSAPTPITSSVDPDATTLQGHAGSVSFGKISGESTRFSSYRRLQVAGLRHQRSRLHAPRRREATSRTGSSGATSSPASTCAPATSTSTSGRAGTSAATACIRAATSTRTGRSTNYYSIGGGINVDAAPFRDRVTRGGPGVLGNPEQELWYYANTDNRKALSFYYNGNHWADTKTARATTSIPASTGARPRRCRSTSGFRYNINHDDAQWVENEDRRTGGQRYVFGRIDQKTVSFTTRFNYTMTPTLSLQVYAEPFVSAPASTRTSRSWSTAAPRTTTTATGRTPTATTPTSTSARSAPPTCCGGNTGRLAAVPGVAAGQVGRPGLRRFPLRPRLRRRLLGAVAQRVPDQVQLLAEYVGQQARQASRPTGTAYGAPC